MLPAFALAPSPASQYRYSQLCEVLQNKYPAFAGPKSPIVADLNPLFGICLKHLGSAAHANVTCLESHIFQASSWLAHNIVSDPKELHLGEQKLIFFLHSVSPCLDRFISFLH